MGSCVRWTRPEGTVAGVDDTPVFIVDQDTLRGCWGAWCVRMGL